MDHKIHHYPHHHRVKHDQQQHHQHHHHARHDHHPHQHHHQHHHHHHHHPKSNPAQAQETARRSSESHLEPFHHQVAGQSLVFRYDAHTICKSLIQRELQFYKTLPDVLNPFVPDYRGIVDIPLKAPSRGENGAREDGEDGGASHHHPLTTQRLLNKVARPSETRDNVYHFILLENIVADLQRPCILDLKMGTRQHGDSATPAKVQYQVNKCRSTTSARLGVRVCGMKVYQCTTGDYLQVNKHEGRKMRKDDFREAIFQFLFNGCDFRRDLIGSLLLQLENLKAAISQLPTYRFYSSSLLIVYDGVKRMCTCNGNPGVASDLPDRERGGIRVDELDEDLTSCQNVDGKPCCGATSCNAFEEMVSCDASSCTSVEVKPTCCEQAKRVSRPTLTEESQNGKVAVESTGLRDAGDEFTNRLSSSGGLCRGRQRSGLEKRQERDCPNGNAAHLAEAPPSPAATEHECHCGLGRVDVRMVDFAHTTFQGYDGDSVVHHGTDHGYLLGLQSLIDIFSTLYNSDM